MRPTVEQNVVHVPEPRLARRPPTGPAGIPHQSSVLAGLGHWEDVEARRLVALPDHDGPGVLDHDLAVLVVAARANLDDALLRPRARLPHIEHLALCVEGVAVEQRVGQLDLVPAQGEAVLADVRHAHPGHDRDSQRAVDEASAPLRLLAVLAVEMDLVAVVGQEREPDVVGLGDGPPIPAAVDVSNVEVLEIAALPPRHDLPVAHTQSLAAAGPAPAHRASNFAHVGFKYTFTSFTSCTNRADPGCLVSGSARPAWEQPRRRARPAAVRAASAFRPRPVRRPHLGGPLPGPRRRRRSGLRPGR